MEGKLDVAYTSGVIAVREKYLLKDKIFRFCESTAEEVFRALLENGFGGGAETATSVHDFEKLIAVEEEKIDAFIREYAPSNFEIKYLLAFRDFHNAKTLIKSAITGEDISDALLPSGQIPITTLQTCVQSADFSALEKICAPLKSVCEEVTSLTEKERTGAQMGVRFERAQYEYLYALVKRRKALKNLLVQKADMTNILTVLRAGDFDKAKEHLLPFGKLADTQLALLIDGDTQAVRSAFFKTPYLRFVEECLRAKEQGVPFTQAEKLRDEYDTVYFAKRKYDLKKNEPFLYYVYRRKTECVNVRIILVCLLAGLNEQEIKRRIRNF